MAAVIAADPRLKANDAARRARDDAAALVLQLQAKRAADAKARTKASLTEAEREKARAQAKRDRATAKRRAVREAAAEKLWAEKAAIREAVKEAAAKAKKSVLKAAWRVETAAAVARGEPFADRAAQKDYMEAKRLAEFKAAKVCVKHEKVPELMTDEMAEWDGEVPW